MQLTPKKVHTSMSLAIKNTQNNSNTTSRAINLPEFTDEEMIVAAEIVLSAKQSNKKINIKRVYRLLSRAHSTNLIGDDVYEFALNEIAKIEATYVIAENPQVENMFDNDFSPTKTRTYAQLKNIRQKKAELLNLVIPDVLMYVYTCMNTISKITFDESLEYKGFIFDRSTIHNICNSIEMPKTEEASAYLATHEKYNGICKAILKDFYYYKELDTTQAQQSQQTSHVIPPTPMHWDASFFLPADLTQLVNTYTKLKEFSESYKALEEYGIDTKYDKYGNIEFGISPTLFVGSYLNIGSTIEQIILSYFESLTTLPICPLAFIARFQEINNEHNLVSRHEVAELMSSLENNLFVQTMSLREHDIMHRQGRSSTLVVGHDKNFMKITKKFDCSIPSAIYRNRIYQYLGFVNQVITNFIYMFIADTDTATSYEDKYKYLYDRFNGPSSL